MKQKAYFVSWHLFVLLTNYYINQSYFPIAMVSQLNYQQLGSR